MYVQTNYHKNKKLPSFTNFKEIISLKYFSWTTELSNCDHITQDLTGFSCDLIW